MKFILKIFAFIFQIVFFSLILGSVFTLLTSKTDALAGIRSFIVISGSMSPTFDAGSVVYTQKQDGYKSGDIVAFNNKTGQVVTHRIVDGYAVAGDVYYQLKGDANNVPDSELINHQDVVGSVIMIIPYLGLLADFLKTPLGFIGLIIVPSTGFILWEIFNIKKELEKDIEKKIMRKFNAA